MHVLCRFVDRDMFMRFRGGAIGHKSIRDDIRMFEDDRDPLDIQYYRTAVQKLGTGAVSPDESESHGVAELDEVIADFLGDQAVGLDSGEDSDSESGSSASGEDSEKGEDEDPQVDEDPCLDSSDEGGGESGLLDTLGYACL